MPPLPSSPLNPTIQRAWEIGQTDPAWWITSILRVRLYRRTLELVNALLAHDNIAVRSGHGVSKTYTLTALAIYWVLVKKGTVIFTGPKFEQVRLITITYLRRILNGAAFPLAPRTSPQADRWVINADTFNGVYIINSSPEQSVNVQGFHSPAILLIADEAAGINDALFEAFAATQASRGVQGALAKVILAGNPTEETGCTHFKKAFAPKSKWHQIHISAYDSPNVTGEMLIPGLVGPAWIQDMKEEWGEESAFFYIRVLGEYHQGGQADRILPEYIVQSMISRAMFPPENIVKSTTQGVDVGRFGDDPSVSVIIKNGVIEDISMVYSQGTMSVARWVAERASTYKCLETVVDETGLGGGVTDVLREQYPETNTHGVNFAAKSFHPKKYKNIRTEMAFNLRDALRDAHLVARGVPSGFFDECRAITYTIVSTGEIQLTAKDDIKTTLGHSPNMYDAAMLAWHGYIRVRETSPEEQYAESLAAALRSAYGTAGSVGTF